MYSDKPNFEKLRSDEHSGPASVSSMLCEEILLLNCNFVCTRINGTFEGLTSDEHSGPASVSLMLCEEILLLLLDFHE